MKKALIIIAILMIFVVGVSIGVWFGVRSSAKSEQTAQEVEAQTLGKAKMETDPYKGPNVIRYTVKLKDIKRKRLRESRL